MLLSLMMTYAELIGRNPFDWDKFLSKMRYTNDQLLDAVRLSADWVTCACGNQCSLIPRNILDGSPRDIQLHTLGRTFYSSILDMWKYHDIRPTKAQRKQFIEARKTARELLSRIERRTAFLLSEIANQTGE